MSERGWTAALTSEGVVESQEAKRRMPGYRNLISWQRPLDVVEAVYGVMRDWLRDEQFGLTQQVRRAAVSVPANIAEGRGRTSAKEFAHRLSIAHGSLWQVETHLPVGERRGYVDGLDGEGLIALTADVGRLLNGLLQETPPAVRGDHPRYDAQSLTLTPDSSRLLTPARSITILWKAKPSGFG